MHYTLLIATQDSAGLVYKISRILYEAGANIERQDEYVDRENALFFMRTSFVVGSQKARQNPTLESRADLPTDLAHDIDCASHIDSSAKQSPKISQRTKTHPLAPSARDRENREYAQDALDSALQATLESTLESKLKSALPNGAKISLKKAGKKSLIILATKENHCLGDLLLRQESGELNAEIKAVIANRVELKSLVERFSIPFFWVDSDGISREEHEGKVGEIIERFSPDLLALAKYMRILSSDFTSRYEGKIINIHHSFLPAFIGANPYKQAFARGVKIIGATAHFVTNELDEGPIIAQDIIHINHTYSWQDMQKAGRDVEKSVFAHALDLVLHDRVFVNGNKTIVF